MTDSERLDLLLQWVRAGSMGGPSEEMRSTVEPPPMKRSEVNRRLKAFVDSEAQITVDEVNTDPRAWQPLLKEGIRKNLTNREVEELRLEELRYRVDQLLGGVMVSFPTLVVGRRDGLEVISGHLPDVVLYLAHRLVLDSGLDLDTCQAPAAGDPGRPNAFDELCGNLFIVERAGRMYCSPACKQRAKNPKWQTLLKKKENRHGRTR